MKAAQSTKSLTIDSEDFREAINVMSLSTRVDGMEAAKQPVLVSAEGKTVTFTSGNEIVASSTLKLNEDSKFLAAMPLGTLKAAAMATGSTMTLTPKDQRVSVKSGAFTANINVCSEISQALWPETKGTELLKMDSTSKLRGLIKMVEGAIFYESSTKNMYARKMLDGLMMDCDSGVLQVYSTDNCRASRASIEAEGKFRVIIPKKAVTALSRFLQDSTGTVTITDYTSRLTVSIGDDVLMLPKMATAPPDGIVKIFDAKYTSMFTADCSTTRASIERVKALTADNIVSFNFCKDKLELAGEDSSMGQAKDSVAGKLKGKEGMVLMMVDFVIPTIPSKGTVNIAFGGQTTIRINAEGCPYKSQHVIVQRRQEQN